MIFIKENPFSAFAVERGRHQVKLRISFKLKDLDLSDKKEALSEKLFKFKS